MNGMIDIIIDDCFSKTIENSSQEDPECEVCGQNNCTCDFDYEEHKEN